MYRVEEHIGGPAFDALEADWEDVAARAPDAKPFQTWRLARGAWRMNHDSIVPRIFVIRDDTGRLVAILPLGMASAGRRPIRYTEIQSIAPGLVDSVGVLVDESHRITVVDAVMGILGQLHREGHLIDIRPVPATNILALAAEQLGPPFRNIALPANRVARLPLYPATWQQVVLDGHTRKEIRRRGRRLHDGLGVATLVARTDAEVTFLANALIPLHVRSEARKGRVSRLAPAAAREWFARFMTDLHARGEAECIGLVTPDQRLIAATYFVRYRGRASLLRAAFDPAYRSLGPGLVVLAAAIDRAIELGDHEVAFGPSADEYKRYWAAPGEEYVRVTCVPRTPRYLMARAWHRVVG
jgi:CelD/BcsL family acetyltransferase involved in cellulose biosynthesis